LGIYRTTTLAVALILLCGVDIAMAQQTGGGAAETPPPASESAPTTPQNQTTTNPNAPTVLQLPDVQVIQQTPEQNIQRR
jgi:hypothetical protein